MRFLYIGLLLAFAFPAAAQSSGTITGRVVDEAGSPLPGANVVVVGRTVGAATNLDGEYRFSVPAGTHVLQASFTGYAPVRATVRVPAGGTVSQDFALTENFVGGGEVVVLGGRAGARTVTDSPVPVDVISAAEIQASGFTDTQQVLQLVVPSYNAPQASITDGSDHVRPATLRGLGPDQVLVLVNGKRRHTSALVHVNGSVGRGSTGSDLNAIPVGAIERVEVLRDGAAAQYGSDAIAGVINIILKKDAGIDAAVSYGQYLSAPTRGYASGEGLRPGDNAGTFSFDDPGETGYERIGAPERVTYADGQTFNAHLGYGLPLDEGSLFVSGQVRLRDDANRAGLDPRDQYYDGYLNDPSFDPDFTEETFDRENHRYGNGAFNEVSLFANGDVPVGSSGMTAYAFGGGGRRSGTTGCFYRRSLDNRTNRALYPDGFLPKINGVINDASISGGLRGEAAGWLFDISETLGTNDFTFNMIDTHNASMNDGQTEFDAGTLGFTQSTTNADLLRAFDIGGAAPLQIAIGGEFRYENYRIDAGEPNSFANGGRTVSDGPNTGASTAPGSQCFPGFQTASEQNQSRSNVGAYLDLETKPVDALLVSAAGRFESYSDFGTTVTGKLATRFEVNDALAIRGAVSTGYRAPSLAQAWFTSIATNFINGVPFEVGTFPVESDLAGALGATTLDPETSINASGGVTFADANVSLTVDGYWIQIKDRITFTENFTGDAVADFLQANGVNATGGRFFTNALDTETRGLDIIGRYGQPVGDGVAKVTLALNLNDTEVTNTNADGIVPSPQQLQDLGQPALIGRQRVGDFEVAQPDSKVLLQIDYEMDNWGAFVRANRYGEVTSLGTSADRDQTFGARVLTDAEVRIDLRSGVRFAIGGNNLLDVYPERQLKVNSFNGIFPYNGFSPFGFLGRYLYTRVAVKL